MGRAPDRDRIFQDALPRRGQPQPSWVAWPDQAAAVACEASFDTDPRWQEAVSIDDMPFVGKRMIFGGFAPVFEASA